MVDWTWLENCKETHEPKFRYMLLSRLMQDCDYYLSYGFQNPRHLWAYDEKDQIFAMLILWNSFEDDEKPEWINLSVILDYAKRMGVFGDEK